jgi:mannan endo-1,4-beta-mannosidase
MDRRKFLAWAGVSGIATTTAAMTALYFRHDTNALDLAKPVSRSRTQRRATFYTQGRHLFDRLGNKVILRGVNKMSVWDAKDPTGKIYFPEIRKTGANSVRIVWAIRKDLKQGTSDTDFTQLDALIANAKANRLIPTIELHDGIGKWDRLPELVTYWTQPAVVKIIKKHQAYLIVNIGGEVGDRVDDSEFIKGYTSAIQTMRSAGIQTPLVIDATEFGKKLDILDATFARLIAADPQQNLLFSVHLYWPISGGADAKFIRSRLQKSVDLGYPLLVGEFSAVGGYTGANKSLCSPDGKIDYQAIIKECQRHEIGWYSWEWGPGNEYGDPICETLNMTPNGLFKNIKPGWATEVAISSPYSIKNTSITPPSM